MRDVPDHWESHKDEPDGEDIVNSSERVREAASADGDSDYERGNDGYAARDQSSSKGVDLDLEGALHDRLASHGRNDTRRDAREEQGDGKHGGCKLVDACLEDLVQAVKVGEILVLLEGCAGDDFECRIYEQADAENGEAEVPGCIAEGGLDGTKAGAVEDVDWGLAWVVGREVVLRIVLEETRAGERRADVERMWHQHSSDHAARTVQALANEDLTGRQEALENWAGRRMDLAESNGAGDEDGHDENDHEEFEGANVTQLAGGRVKS